jgi:pyruvate kinase
VEKEPSLGFYLDRNPSTRREELARAACRLADSLKAPAIVVVTRRGKLAQAVASFRPKHAIIYAFTNIEHVRNGLWMTRSIVPFMTDLDPADPEQTLRFALQRLRERNRLLHGDPVVVVSDIVAGEDRVTSIQVRHFDFSDFEPDGTSRISNPPASSG